MRTKTKKISFIEVIIKNGMFRNKETVTKKIFKKFVKNCIFFNVIFPDLRLFHFVNSLLCNSVEQNKEYWKWVNEIIKCLSIRGKFFEKSLFKVQLGVTPQLLTPLTIRWDSKFDENISEKYIFKLRNYNKFLFWEIIGFLSVTRLSLFTLRILKHWFALN